MGIPFEELIDGTTWENKREALSEAEYAISHTQVNDKIEDDLNMGLNEIGRISLRTSVPLLYDSYKLNRNTGSFILVDEITNQTVAAGMII